MGSAHRGYAPWIPERSDRGQAEERTLEEAYFDQGCAGLTDDEAFAKAFRASEVERVMAELCRASAAAAPGAVQEWSAAAVASLNLMGIETVLPGEEERCPAADGAPPPSSDSVVRIDLRYEVTEGELGGPDQLDALSGLICDFQRTTRFVNGLRMVATQTCRGPVQWSLEARHRGIVAAFGDFVMDKYVTEAWRLV